MLARAAFSRRTAPQKFEYFSLSKPPPGFRSPGRYDYGPSFGFRQVPPSPQEDEEDRLNLRRDRFEGFAAGSVAGYFRRHRGAW